MTGINDQPLLPSKWQNQKQCLWLELWPVHEQNTGEGGDDCDCNLINPMVRDIEVIPINPTMSF